MLSNLNTNKSPSDPWYHVDQKGRQIGWMWPEDFKRDLEAIWGRGKGIAGFSEYTGFNRTTVERYCNGKQPVPKAVALLSQSLLLLVPKWRERQSVLNKTRGFPKLDAPWLPGQEKTDKLGLASRPFG